MTFTLPQPPFAPMRWHRFLYPLFALLAPVACAQQPEVTAPVTRIVLEQGCFGCAGTTVLALRSDGRATLTTTGSARHGSAELSQAGTIVAADFQALARLALVGGFFDMPEVLDNPQQRDGAWTTVRLRRNGQDKQVFWREGVAAPALSELTTAIESVRQRIAFAPAR